MSIRQLTLGLTVAAALVGSGLTAGAADLDDNYGYADQLPAAPPVESKVEFGSGWYVRGDLGATSGLSLAAGSEPYSTSSITSASYANGSSYTQGVFSGPGSVPPSLTTSGATHIIVDGTLGFGYQFNKWLRADLTADFRQPTKSSYQGTGVPCITGTQGIPNASGVVTSENIISTTCTPTLSAYLQSFSVLANGYVDLGTWSRFTPYVGAGLGLSFGHAHAISTYYQGNGNAYAGTTYTDALAATTFEQNFDRSQTREYYNFAYAFMGGVAIDIYPHTKLDIGYRYLHLGQVLGTNLTAQEARAGLRYMIDN